MIAKPTDDLSTATGFFGLALLAFSLVIGIGSTGCRPTRPVGTLAGTVAIEGKPLKSGVVCVGSAEGGGGTAPLDESGGFRFAGGLPLGDYRVWLRPPALPPEALNPELSPGSAEARALLPYEQAVKMFQSRVPKSYADSLATPLTVTIKQGHTDLPINITK